MQDQPPPVNGNAPDESAIDDRKVSASQQAYESAARNLTSACSMLVAAECPNMPPQLGNMLVYLVSAARLREVELAAIVELQIAGGIASKDQWMDKTAALAERYTQAMCQKLEDAPKLVIATGNVKRN
jgi:hypothetical protein